MLAELGEIIVDPVHVFLFDAFLQTDFDRQVFKKRNPFAQPRQVSGVRFETGEGQSEPDPDRAQPAESSAFLHPDFLLARSFTVE